MRNPIIFGCLTAAFAVSAAATVAHGAPFSSNIRTKTPIKHLVVIFQENVSFDHYFGTYPNAANLSGETPFHAAGTPTSINNLITSLDTATILCRCSASISSTTIRMRQAMVKSMVQALPTRSAYHPRRL